MAVAMPAARSRSMALLRESEVAGAGVVAPAEAHVHGGDGVGTAQGIHVLKPEELIAGVGQGAVGLPTARGGGEAVGKDLNGYDIGAGGHAFDGAGRVFARGDARHVGAVVPPPVDTLEVVVMARGTGSNLLVRAVGAEGGVGIGGILAGKAGFHDGFSAEHFMCGADAGIQNRNIVILARVALAPQGVRADERGAGGQRGFRDILRFQHLGLFG